MGYSVDDAMVRVDFFREAGKWYTTEAIKWTGEYQGGSIHLSLRQAIAEQCGNSYSGMIAVCLEPYHEHSHPIMIRI